MQRAAQRVHLTQPAISKLVREMETMFGAALFTRSKRGVVLTECGRALAARAEYLLNDIERARDEVAAIHHGTLGSLRIGALPVAESHLLPQALMALRKVAPKLHIRVQEGTTSSLLDQLRRGEIDCVIGRLDGHATIQDLRTERLVKLPTRLVVRSKHPLARHRAVTPELLAAYPWVMPQSGAPIRIVIESIFTSAGLPPPVPLVESALIRLNYELVRISYMIGVMPDDAAKAYAGAKSLVILPFDLGDRLPFVGVTTGPGPASQALTLFLRVLRQSCG